MEKLDKLLQQKEKLNLAIAKEKEKHKKKVRRDDTRRKILTGALALSHMEKDAEFKAVIDRLLSEGLKKDGDRELFNLPVLAPAQES